VDEFSGARVDLAALGAAGDGHAAAAAKVDQSLVPEGAQSAQDGVAIYAEHAGEVRGGRESFTRAGLAVGDRPTDLGGDLVSEAERGGAAAIDRVDDASDTSFMRGARVAASESSLVAERLLALFDEAWRRARRRRRWTAVLVGAVAVVAAGVLLTRGHDRPRIEGAPKAPKPVPLALPEPPGMGVACPGAPNSIACDRVAIGVSMTTTPRRLVATVGGRSVLLRDQTSTCAGDPPCAHPYTGPHFYTGFLQPAGLLNGALRVTPDAGRYRWYGRHPLTARLRITATYANGTTATTSRRVPVAPGWG